MGLFCIRTEVKNSTNLSRPSFTQLSLFRNQLGDQEGHGGGPYPGRFGHWLGILLLVFPVVEVMVLKLHKAAASDAVGLVLLIKV